MKTETKTQDSPESKQTVWFGNMETIRFTVGADEFDAVIVHQIALISRMTEQEADEFMWEFGYDSYLIPDTYKGEILFSHKEKRSK
jgi:hypothetical protein